MIKISKMWLFYIIIVQYIKYIYDSEYKVNNGISLNSSCLISNVIKS